MTGHAKSIERSKTPPWAVVLIFLIVGMAAYIVFHLMNEISKDSASQSPTLRTATVVKPPVPQPYFVTIADTAITVNADSYAWYTFTVPPGANTVVVNGHFTATGGSGNDIEVYILNEDGFVNLKNGHATRTFYNSGKVTTAAIGAVLPNLPATYYLVFDNQFSLLTPKAVQITAKLSYVK